MTNVLGILFVPAVLFMVIVAPLWLIFHYVTVWKTQRNAGRADPSAMNGMWDTARRLEDRVAALEKLLDAEAPGWRSKAL
ncbi:MAG TPA: envelope stress response membrane protein PspB [Hyphomonadaceae bacterium]|jgi:phage shock protein B|nr:envelope stress response membrane protein PspB [Hyphomonadaceae bacterium]